MIVASCLLAFGCADSDGGDAVVASTAAPTTVPSTTVAPVTVTTTPDTTTPDTTIPDSTVAVTTTEPLVPEPTDAEPCEFAGAQTEQQFDFPNLMTSEIGADIRTGVHPCFERIVIELQAGPAPTDAGLPGWLVRYAEGPVTLGQTGDQVVELDGDADLLITMNAWMHAFDENNTVVGYLGPPDIRPSGTHAIRQLRLIDDFEGQSTWAAGLDQRRDFRVFTLTGPDRLVVDIAT